MPTLNPRVNVTLSPSLDSLVARLAELERVSKSQVLRELLETAEPALSHAVALMEAAQGASAKARSNLAKDLHSGIKAVEGTSELMLQNFAHHTRDMVTEAEAIRGRRPAAPVRGVPRAVRSDPAPRKRAPGGGIRAIGAKRPPLSNRGVKS
jgi:hypothetical protein